MKIKGSIKRLFMSRYKKLLFQIQAAINNEQRLRLPNGVWLDFVPGHEYDHCMSVLPHTDDKESFAHKYISHIGQVVHMDVYDCFGGDVKILAVGEDKVFVEIVEAFACYGCQSDPVPGTKYWIEDWCIAPETETKVSASAAEKDNLPF